jgi:hypothetical protein
VRQLDEFPVMCSWCFGLQKAEFEPFTWRETVGNRQVVRFANWRRTATRWPVFRRQQPKRRQRRVRWSPCVAKMGSFVGAPACRRGREALMAVRSPEPAAVSGRGHHRHRGTPA